jgi:hypothetical protein
VRGEFYEFGKDSVITPNHHSEIILDEGGKHRQNSQHLVLPLGQIG